VFAPPGAWPIQRAIAEAGIETAFGPPDPALPFGPAEWMRRLATLPLMAQPGEAWMYTTGSSVLGVLLARAAGRPLPELMRERIFEPLGMPDTAFHVPPGKRDRLPAAYFPGPDGLRLTDDPAHSRWAEPPAFPAADAGPVFDTLVTLRQAGKIDAYGWSTDFPDRAVAFADREGFVAVEHAMNVFVPATTLMAAIEQHGLLSINRGPLAMGLLTGKFDARSVIPKNDVRSNTMSWLAYFKGGKVAPGFVERLDAIRDLLTTDGRTLSQGSLAWLWARSPQTLPIPGFRSVAQVDENYGALAKGPLPAEVMAEIERVIAREPEGEPRER